MYNNRKHSSVWSASGYALDFDFKVLKWINGNWLPTIHAQYQVVSMGIKQVKCSFNDLSILHCCNVDHCQKSSTWLFLQQAYQQLRYSKLRTSSLFRFRLSQRGVGRSLPDWAFINALVHILAVSESFAQSLMALSPVRTISMSPDESMPFGGRRYWHWRPVLMTMQSILRSYDFWGRLAFLFLNTLTGPPEQTTIQLFFHFRKKAFCLKIHPAFTIMPSPSLVKREAAILPSGGYSNFTVLKGTVSC